MVNTPNSFEFEIYFTASHLYDVCQLCLPIIEESGLPNIREWEIPLDETPQSEGLDEKLAELRAQKERGDKDAPDLSRFELGEGNEEQGRDLVLRLRYYEHREKYLAGQCGLHMYIHKHNTVEEIRDFVDRGFDFCHRLIEKKDVNRLFLYRGTGINDYIPDAPLLSDKYQIVFISPESVERKYDNPEAFWNYPWDNKEHWRDRYLLTRCLDMSKYADNGAYRAAIIEPH